MISSFRTRPPAESLFRVGQHLTGLLLEALLTAPPTGVMSRDMADRMRVCKPIPAWHKVIEARLAERQMWDVDAAAMMRLPERWDWRGCCATLRPHEALGGITPTMREGAFA